jgi:hypothetical protein
LIKTFSKRKLKNFLKEVKMTRKITIIFTIVVLLLLFAPTRAILGGQNGTTLKDAYVTATGFFEKTITYDWDIQKTVDPTSISICSGETGSVYYTISLTKTQVSEVDVYGVRGTVTFTNGGAEETENLKIVVKVLYKTGGGPYQELGASETIIPTSQLQPGETGTYNYEIIFTPVPGALYKVSADITITNHSGHLGVEWGPSPDAGFSLPDLPTITYVDDCVTLSDVLNIPSGFTANYQGGSPNGTYSSTTSFGYLVDITNTSAMCDSYYTLTNTATIAECDSKTTHSSGTSVEIYTCPCGGGCTLTIGYWKTHAGFTGKNPDRVTQYLPISLGSTTVGSASDAVYILNFQGQASNGINKLMAQLLAARLNIANGADGSAVSDTITAADAFLATYGPSSWGTLTKAQKNQVLQWMTTLDNYNNGYIGPGHCN